MTHFARPKDVLRSFFLDRPIAAVTVEVVQRRHVRIVPESIAIAKHDVEWTMMPKDSKVLSCDGDAEVQPSSGRAFLVSVETIDPFHMVCEAPTDDIARARLMTRCL